MTPETLVRIIAFNSGVFVALLVGALFTRQFLRKSVTAKVPSAIMLPDKSQNYGGAGELGSLEILLYFASLWLGYYQVAGAWLVFKVGAKWAAWQHITKIPDKMPDKMPADDIYLPLRERSQLSNHLLGRFLNGTLFNIICAGIGSGTARSVEKVSVLSSLSLCALYTLGVVTSLFAFLLAAWLLFCKTYSSDDL